MRRPFAISDYEDLIYGVDGSRSIDKSIGNAIQQGTENKSRIRAEIRIKHAGQAGGSKAHQFVFDANPAHIENVKRKIVDLLNDDPGPTYEGQIRVNFKLNASGEHLNSFTRTIQIGIPERSSGFDLDNDGDELDESVDNVDHEAMLNAMGALGGGGQREPTGMEGLPPLMKQYLTMLMADANDRRQQLDIIMGFMHRKDAMMMTMFDRAIRAMENYSLRFGLPNNPPGISDVVRDTPPPDNSGGGGGGGLGLLPQILAVAGQIAQGGGAGGGAAAPAPAPAPARGGGANRMNRIRSAGQSMRQQRPMMPEPASGYDTPDGYDGGLPDHAEESPGMDGYRQETMQPMIEDHGAGGFDDGGFDDGGFDDPGYDDDGGGGDGGGDHGEAGANLQPPT